MCGDGGREVLVDHVTRAKPISVFHLSGLGIGFILGIVPVVGAASMVLSLISRALGKDTPSLGGL